MLVLNRRPGESVIIEPDVHVTVLSVADRRVRISLRTATLPALRVSAMAVSGDEARLEVGPLGSVTFDGAAVRLDPAGDGDPASDAHAALALDRNVGERVDIGDSAWVAVAAVSKGNPCVAFGGPAIGEELRITLIRPAGSYVRLGVEAPNRRVYREELWTAMQASGALDGLGGPFDAHVPRPNGHAADGAASADDAPASEDAEPAGAPAG